MVKISDETLINTLPNSINRDANVINIAEAIEEQLHSINSETGYVLLLPRLDELSESLIDELAWQYHVDFYENDAPIEVKRDLVRNAIKWHRRKGTPYAVESVCQTAFRSCSIKEWFDYGANPYHFKIEDIADNMPDELTVSLIADAIDKTKNVRSWCDGFGFKRDVDEELYIALMVNLEKEVTIKQIVNIIKESSMTEYYSAGMVIYRKVEMR